MNGPHLIGIAGPSGAGKTALASCLAARLPGHATAVLSLDSYYLDQAAVAGDTHASLNFDTPDALDLDLLASHLRRLITGRPIERPVYDFRTHARTGRTERIVPGAVVVVEGLLVLHRKEIRDLLGTRVFIVADDATCLARRVDRDARERGRTEESVRDQWVTTVRPMFERYVESTQRYADVVVDGTEPLERVADVVVAQIRRLTQIRTEPRPTGSDRQPTPAPRPHPQGDAPPKGPATVARGQGTREPRRPARGS